jgi:hypothetical protein
MPKYITKIVNGLLLTLTLRQLRLLEGWVKNTDPQIVQSGLTIVIENAIKEAEVGAGRK